MTFSSLSKKVTGIASLASIFVFGTYFQGTLAQEDLVFPPGSKPYGIGYEQWGVKWWQWALSIPSERHPLNDPTGDLCGVKQASPVWFLGSTFGGTLQTVRTCTIPAGNSILFPPVISECNFSEHPEYKAESELRNCAKTFQDQTTLAVATVDGKRIENVTNYRIETPLFNTTFPKNNVYGVSPRSDQEVKGETWTNQHVSDGIWIMLKPLPPGRHTIEFEGASVSQTNTWEAEVKYNLIIK
jgi:hypothetical protein